MLRDACHLDACGLGTGGWCHRLVGLVQTANALTFPCPIRTFLHSQYDSATNDFVIRPERLTEQREVETLIRNSFWNIYQPGCSEHYLMHRLRQSSIYMPELNLVMAVPCYGEERGVGQALSVRSAITTDAGRSLPVATLGPICIHPDWQHRGLGSALLQETMLRAKDVGFGAVCLEGDIRFYGRCGFVHAADLGIRLHDSPDAVAPYFLMKELQEGLFNGVRGEICHSD